jgi:hypothetical protein
MTYACTRDVARVYRKVETRYDKTFRGPKMSRKVRFLICAGILALIWISCVASGLLTR